MKRNQIMLGIKSNSIWYKKEILRYISITCLIIAIILPLLIGVYYAVPAADDFSNTNMLRGALQNNSIPTAVSMYMKEIYMTCQGTFTSTFFVAVFAILRILGITNIKLSLYINVLFLMLSMLWFGNVIAKKMFGLYNIYTRLIFLVILTYISFGICRGGQEVFFWHTGAYVYTIPMSLTFCSMALYIQYLWEEKSFWRLLTLCVLAFLASGGVLQVTAILCYGLLVIWGTYLYKEKNRDGIFAGIPFLAAFVGALINVISPGNYIRHANVEEGIHIFKAIKNVLKIVVSQIRGMLTENLFLYIVIGCCLFGIFMALKFSMKIRTCHLLWLFWVLMMGFVISVFPYCLGTGGTKMALRNLYICDLYFGWSCAIVALEFGIWLGIKKKGKINKDNILIIIVCIGVIFFRTGDIWKIFREGSGRAFYELCAGDIQRCSLEWNALLSRIENAEEDEVLLEIPEIPDTILKVPGLNAEKTNWDNTSIASYYGKDMVVINWKNE